MRSTLVAVGLALLACVPAAAAVTGQRTVSFRNSRAPLPDDIYAAQLQATRGIACLPAFPPGIKPPPGLPVPTAPRQLTFAAALASAQKVAGLNGARGRKLRASALFKTTIGAERLAAAGLLGKADKGALAALLVAAVRSPRDPLPLIDAAALLIDAKKPNEALALLAQARKLPQRKLRQFGLSTVGILETNRAAAYFRTGQYALAVSAGRRALRSSTWLVEARENVGMALLCQGKEQEAACEFRAAMKRPLEPGEERLTCVGARAATPGDFGYSVATPGVYPAIGYPALPSKADGYVAYYDRLNSESHARLTAADAEYDRLVLKLQTPDSDRLPASRSRASDLVIEMLKVPARASFVTQRERGEQIVRDISQLAADTAVELDRVRAQCAPSEQCFHDRCQTVLQQSHPVFLNRQTELEAVMRAWWRDLHAEMEGYAQAIGSEDENAMAVTQIDAQGLMGWNVIIGGAVAWNGVPASLKAACLDPLPSPPVDETVAPDGTPRNPCPPSLSQLKAKFDIGSGKVEGGPLQGASYKAGISVNCSEVTVSTDASWSPMALLSGFGKMAYTQGGQGGKLTIGIGSKAGVGPVGFESGLQLTLTSHNGGTNVDLAWRTGPSAGSKSDVQDISIYKSVAPPQALPSFPTP